MKETLKKVMKRAWEIKREDKRNIFGECLRMAWVEIKAAAKNVVFTKIAPWFLKKMDSVTFMALESGICVGDMVIEKETEKAICVSTEWDGYRKMMWFPKSVVEYKMV